MNFPLLFGVIDNWVSIWLTPLWILGVGALIGLALLTVVWGLLFLVSRIPGLGSLADQLQPSNAAGGANVPQKVLRSLVVLFSRRTVTEIPMAVREGALWPIFIVTASVAAFGVLGAFFVDKPADILSSLARLPYVGTTVKTMTVPVSELEDPDDAFSSLIAHQVPVAFRFSEVHSLKFESDQNLTIAIRPFEDAKPGASLEVIAGEPTVWYRASEDSNQAVTEDVSSLYIRNLGSASAELKMTLVTQPPHPEVAQVPITAIFVVIVFLLYVWQRATGPRLSAIALATYKSEVAQPLFMILVMMGVVCLFLFVWIPYNTFGEDIKVLKDTGLIWIMVLGIFCAVWAASTSVADEIEGKTALTVLSKPIGRRSFVLGKFLGITWTVAVLFTILGLWLLIWVAYKPIHEARESSTSDLTWQLCHLEMFFTVPGLALAFMETVVLAAISVAISTRLPLLANLIICMTIYALGHLTPLIVQSSAGEFAPVQFFGQLIATILPNLDHFNIQAAVAAGLPVPYVYLFWAFCYCLVYTTIAMLLALVLFEDRDLA